MQHLPEIIMTMATILAILGCSLPAWDLKTLGKDKNSISSNVGLWQICGNGKITIPVINHEIGLDQNCVAFDTSNKPASLVAVEIFSILAILAMATSALLFFTKHQYSRITALFGSLFAIITFVVYLSSTRDDLNTSRYTLGPALYIEIGAAIIAMLGVFVHGKVTKRRRR